MASHLGMSLRECMEKHTHRELQAWIDWLDQQYNQPSRTDWYLMQLASVCAAPYMKRKNPKPNDFKLKFQIGELTEEEKRRRMEQSKSAWAAALGGGKPQQLPQQLRK